MNGTAQTSKAVLIDPEPCLQVIADPLSGLFESLAYACINRPALFMAGDKADAEPGQQHHSHPANEPRERAFLHQSDTRFQS
ncbi:Unknown protein sequence [Pseudomonas syringae pv. syringae]|nr:Unknown protein sequence [Pseudomonas syringae pv. syringae]